VPPRSSVKARNVLMAIHPPVSSVPLVTSEHRSIWHFRTRGHLVLGSHIFSQTWYQGLVFLRPGMLQSWMWVIIRIYCLFSELGAYWCFLRGWWSISAFCTCLFLNHKLQKTHKVIHEIATRKTSSDGASIANSVFLAPTPVNMTLII